MERGDGAGRGKVANGDGGGARREGKDERDSDIDGPNNASTSGPGKGDRGE